MLWPVAISLALGLTRPAVAEPDGDGLVVIVADSIPLQDLSERELRRVFLGENLKDPDGNPLVPLNQPPKTAARMAFDLAVLEMGPEAVGRYWVDQRIRGRARAPRSHPSEEMLVAIVERFPGAITYVSQASLTPGVRTVTIGGLEPGDPDYALAAGE